MPATYRTPSARAGVARIQLPFLAAKNGTFSDPSHSVFQSSLPVVRSRARTTSLVVSTVPVT